MENTYNNKRSVELALETIVKAQEEQAGSAELVNVMIGNVGNGRFGSDPMRIFEAPAYIVTGLVNAGFSVSIEEGSAVVEKFAYPETAVI